MKAFKIDKTSLRHIALINTLYDHINQTCLVIVDRSMWFAKSYEVVSENNFQHLVQKHRNLAGKENSIRQPIIFAFNYAQRVFLCSAIELCLMHQYNNSVALLMQLFPSHKGQLKRLFDIMKRRHNIKTSKDWDRLDWDIKLEILRELSFSNIRKAAALFDEIYGDKCFNLIWGKDKYQQLTSQYQKYQTLRNGILHRGGELSSGIRIEATESDIATTFEDAKLFRDAIIMLSDWCRAWWVNQIIQPDTPSLI